MSEHIFLTGTGHVHAARAERIDAVAKAHGAQFVAATIPGDGPRYWFTAQNRGAPFDDDTRDEVCKALKEAGLWPINA